MWFFLGALVVGLILSVFLAPKIHTENAKAAQLSDFQFPRSDEGAPVPRIYGTVKSTGVNTIGQCNFQAVPITQRVKTGLFSHKRVTVGYKYHTGLDLGVCLGPDVVYRRIWYGTNLIWAGCLYSSADCCNRINIDLPNLLGGTDSSGTGNGGIGGWIALYCGAFDQAASAYLATNLTKPNPDDAMPSYPGVAHAVFEDFYWGNSANIDTIAIEVSVFSNSLSLIDDKHVMANGLDANPVEVLYDLFVTGWGNLGISSSNFNVANWQAAAYKIYDENNGVSCEIANPNTGADIAKNILQQIDGMIYQNPQSGEIEIMLMRRDYDVTTLPVLGPDQISALSSFTKKLWADTFNRVRIKYKNRDNNYADATASADDFGNIRYQGHLRPTDIGMPMCYVSSVAAQLAARSLSNLNVPLYQCDVEMNRVHSDLTPGSVFVLNWPEYGITSMVMRVRKVGLGSRKSGKVKMTVVQDQFSSDAVVTAAPSLPTTDGTSYLPGDITAPIFFELPYWLANTSSSLADASSAWYGTFAVKPGAASMDYSVFIIDSGGDIEILSNAAYEATARLTTVVGQFDGFASGMLAGLTVGTLSATSALSNGTLAALQASGAGLFYLNGEILGYETFVDNGDGTYTLHNVHRALMDTAPVAGAIGDTILFFNGPEGFWANEISNAPLNVYALDRAITGPGSTTTATHFALTPVQRQLLPVPPDNVTVGGVRSATVSAASSTTINLAWFERSRVAANIPVETDATVAPEAGTTYDVELWNSDTTTLVTSALGIAATVEALAVPAAAISYTGLLKVYAVRGGSRSFTPALFPVSILGDDTLLTEEGETRLTEDGFIRAL